MIPHMPKKSKGILPKPRTTAQSVECDAAFPVIGDPELLCRVASVESLGAVAVAVQTKVFVVSAGGNQLAKAGWNS